MRLATAEQSAEIDELSHKVYGLTGEILMESAGCMAAREIEQAYFPELKSGPLSIVCGPGNNGGDGLVVARHMHSAQHRDLVVYLLADSHSQSPLNKQQLHRAQLHGVKVINLREHPEKLEQLRSSAVIVDALFGVGLSRPLQGEYLKVVDLINSIKAPVISLDVPTGLEVNRGIAAGTVVKAGMTICFGLAKPGFFVGDGPQAVGKLRVISIGYPYECLRGVATSHFLFTEKLARRYLPNRGPKTNKSNFGHALVIAGKPGTWGAGILASQSAFRVGAGYVTWASLPAPLEVLKETPEVMTMGLDEADLLTRKIPTAIAIGPGLGKGAEVAGTINRLKSLDIPVVVDADAIHVCVEENLFPLPKRWILTPHAGELAKIIDESPKDIEVDRFKAALRASEIAGCHILLKGFRSIIAFEQRCMVIHSGNSALAKAGTGDVLTGMIAGMLAQGLETVQGAATATYIHGRMADEWVRAGKDRRSLSASDLKAHLPELMSRLAGGALV